MALDLAKLRNGDHAEWNQAMDELQLWSVAKKAVWGSIGSRFPQYVEDVAAKALNRLAAEIMKYPYRYGSIDVIVRNLRRKALDESVAFLRRAFTKNEVHRPDEQPEVADQGVENSKRAFEMIAEQLKLEKFDLEVVLTGLINHLDLGPMEEALLREHIVNGATQDEFARKHKKPLGTVGRETAELRRRLRRFPGRLLRVGVFASANEARPE